jgi:DNA-binding transcriptional regulator YiaG
MRGFSAGHFSAVRRGSGLSVSDLSCLAGVGTSTVHAWEAGRATPQIDLLARIVLLLETPINEVVTKLVPRSTTRATDASSKALHNLS